MARTAGVPSKVYVDEVDFSGRSNSVEFNVDVNLPEITSFSDGGLTYVEGKYGSQLMLNGFFDPASGNFDDAMWAAIADGTDHYVGAYMGNSAPAEAKGYEIIGRVKGQPRRFEVSGAALLNVSWQGDGAAVRSTVLCNGAVTGTGAVTDSNQNTGATSSGETFVAILRVLSVTGSGSIVVKVEDSDDDAVGDPYAELIAFTTATAVGVERKTVATATKAYKRVNVTTFSGFSSVTILVVVGKEQAS